MGTFDSESAIGLLAGSQSPNNLATAISQNLLGATETPGVMGPLAQFSAATDIWEEINNFLGQSSVVGDGATGFHIPLPSPQHHSPISQPFSQLFTMLKTHNP